MFKKYFIPGEHNDHRPHILRRRAVFMILVLVLLAEGFFLLQIFPVSPLTDIFSSVLPGVLVELANSDRQQNNVHSLAVNSLLRQAAELKAVDMAAKGYFAHESPDGKTPWYWLDQVGYNYQWAGENLAVNFMDSAEIEAAWMNSESHRANILNFNFTEVGVAAASGTYKGQPAIFVVQFFGKPVLAVQAKITPQASPDKILSSPPPPAAVQSPLALAPAVPSVEPEVVITKESAESTLAVAGTVEGVKNNQLTAKQPPVSLWRRILTMPKTTLNYFYLLIMALVILALALKIFVKIKIQYPKLIFNGIFVLFVIISIQYLNYLIIKQGGVF